MGDSGRYDEEIKGENGADNCASGFFFLQNLFIFFLLNFQIKFSSSEKLKCLVGEWVGGWHLLMGSIRGNGDQPDRASISKKST